MIFYLTKIKFEEMTEFLIGPKRVGEQYVLPLELTKQAYLDDLARRTKLGSIVALFDLLIAGTLGSIFSVVKFFIIRFRRGIWYVLYNNEDRRKVSEIVMIDWGGNVHKNEGLYRQRTALMNIKMEVTQEQLKTEIVKL